MAYALIKNGQVASYPYTLAQFRRDNLGVDLPHMDDAEEFGVVFVEETDPPSFGEGQTLDQDLPIKVSGVWKQNWITHDWLTIEPDGLYARIDGNDVIYPYTEWDVRRDFEVSARPGAIKQMDGQWGVVEVQRTDPPVAPANKYVAALPPVNEGGVWKQAWALRNRTADELTAARLAKQDEIRARRWQAENAGTTFNGVSVATDEKSQNKIAGAVALFEKDPTLTNIDFEAQPGLWIAIDQATTDALGVLVGRHVQACFSRSKTLIEACANASWAELAALDIDTGWPS